MPYHLDYTLPSLPKGGPIPNPPGYLPPTSANDLARIPAVKPETIAIQARRSTDLKIRRAWDLALAPAKSLPMQGIMLYFSGSGVQIFSLGMIFMLVTGPITAVFSIFRAFEAFRPTPPQSQPSADAGTTEKAVAQPSYAPLTLPMMAYVGCQAAVFALGLYKCSTMGILPTGSSDWLQFETRNDPPEWSAARAFSLG